MSPSAIDISELKFSWVRGVDPILDIAKLSVPRGQKLFIKGPSGSGKSTLLNILGALLMPNEGNIHVLGQNLRELGQSRRDGFRADHIGFIFQQFNLIPYLNVIQNVCLGVRFSKRRLHQATASGCSVIIEAHRLLNALGLDDMLMHRRVTDLSVGQQQRVAAARALLGNPELVIADEPTSSLDSDSRKAFIELLEHECTQSNATLVFVSHDPTLGDGFDRIIDLATINTAASA